MYEPLERLINRSRQRHFTDDEITGIASHAHRLAGGCEVLEGLRPHETTLVHDAVAETAERFPDLASTTPGAVELLEQSLLILLRQAAFAMAVDDYSRLCEVLCDLQAPYWTSGLGGDVTEYATAALRDKVMATLGNQHGKAFDAWLQVGARFLTVTAEVGAHCPQILDEAVATLFTRHPDLASKYVDCQRKTAQDYERVLLHTLRGFLPDGEQRLFRMLRTFHEAIVPAKFGATLMEDAYELLAEVCRKHLHAARSVELFAQLQVVTDFITLSADLGEHLETMVTTSVDALYRLHPQPQLTQEYVEKTRRDERLILEACAYATLPGGQDELVRVMMDFQGTLTRFNFGARLITDAYKILLDTCRATLRARSRMTLIPVVHHTVHFLAIAADLAEKGEAMLAGVTDHLAALYPTYYAKSRVAQAYTLRDQEQILFHLALGLLPGATTYTVGRFAFFGEVIIQNQFDESLMLTSFDLLETACMETLEAQSLAFLMPRWHQVRRYLEVCVQLATCEEKIVKDVLSALQGPFGVEMEQFANGAEKTARDLRALLRTAALSAVPGGEGYLVRGLSLFMDSILATKMPRKMLYEAYGTLIRTVQKTLLAPHQAWLVPVLERCQAFINVAAELGEHLDSIVAEVVETTLHSSPEHMQRYPGARRKSADDFDQTLRRSALALLPGGSSELAEGLWAFSSVLWANQFGAPFLTEAYGNLRQKAWAQLDLTAMKAFGATLDRTLNAITCLAELAECADTIVHECVETLYAKYAVHLQQFPNCRDKIQHDMQCVLRGAAIAIAEGGSELLAQHLQMFAEILLDGRFGAACMWDAYDGLVMSTARHVRHPARQTLVSALEKARDYIALMAGLADKEVAILHDAVAALFAKRGEQLGAYPQARAATEHDQRLLLRSSALALLPGGRPQHEELVALMRTVTQRHQFDQDLMLYACALLQQSCVKHLEVGPVQQLTGVLQQAARQFAA